MTMRQAEVVFPVKVAAAGCKPHRVEVTAYPTSHRGRKSCPSGKSDEVKRLLGYARYGEGIEAVDMDVVVHMDDTDFDEGSFGLAVAVCDKLARFGAAVEVGPVVATGMVGNRGVVSAVAAFSDKLAWVAESQPSGSLFLFPQDNAKGAEEGLAKLSTKGIRQRGVASVGELSNLWNEPGGGGDDGQVDVSAPRTWHAGLAVFVGGAILGFLLVAGLVML